MAEYGLTTLGVELWGAITDDGSKVTDATKYSRFSRITSIGEMSISANNIDVSAIEDFTSRYKAGRSDVSDTYAISFLLTDETIAEWRAVAGRKVCFLTYVPELNVQIFVIAEVPADLPAPGIDGNAALTATINCTTNEFIGYDTPVEVSASISFDKTSATIAVAGTTTITPTYTPSGATVTWKSSDTSVATVSAGTVTGVSAGTVAISASVTSGGITKRAMCYVIVTST